MLKNLGCIGLVIGIIYLAGWIICFVKFIQLDFEAPYKAEIVYGIGTVTSLGGIVGWIPIDDTPKEEGN